MLVTVFFFLFLFFSSKDNLVTVFTMCVLANEVLFLFVMQMYVTPPDTDVYAIPRVLAPMPQKVWYLYVYDCTYCMTYF